MIDFIELSTADVAEILCCPGVGSDASKAPSTVAQETAAIKTLALRLKCNEHLKRDDAKEWLRESDHELGDRAFQYRVWPQARVRAGLEPKAAPGRKRKLSR